MIPVKINGTGRIESIKAYSAQVRKAEMNNKAGGQVRGDTLEISNEARKVQSYKGVLDEISPVREDLVASLKKQIDEGTYRTDSRKIASRMIQERLIDKAGHKNS